MSAIRLALGPRALIESYTYMHIKQFRKDELRCRMMGRAEDTLEELEEEGKGARKGAAIDGQK